jgi:hypothetical protein
MTTQVSPVQSTALAPGAAAVTGAASAAPAPQGPAASASARVFGANALLGILGLASAAFVLARLFASWHLGSQPASHRISVFGQQLSYPAANADAIVVTALAALGLLMLGAAAWSVARELLADRRFRAAMAAQSLPLHEAWLIDEDRPQAFCAGLLRPRVYCSTGALELLDAPELAAVLAHERHHARQHDPLRLVCGRALAAGLFFIPAVSHLVRRQHELAEISADEAAVHSAGGDRSALASAMLSFSQASGTDALGVDPERIDHLLGEGPAWRFPILLCLVAAAALSVFIAAAALAAQAAAGSATLAPPFLSGQPCVAVLAMIPAAAGLSVVAYARRRHRPPAVAPARR